MKIELAKATYTLTLTDYEIDRLKDILISYLMGLNPNEDYVGSDPECPARQIVEAIHRKRTGKDYFAAELSKLCWTSAVVQQNIRDDAASNDRADGVCPKCLKRDGLIRVGMGMYGYCAEHKFKWCTYSGHRAAGYTEADEARELQAAKELGLETFRDVSPTYGMEEIPF